MKQRVALARMLISRLERLSADSYWAHQASGVRGSLLKLMDSGDLNSAGGDFFVERGFELLEKAAKEK